MAIKPPDTNPAPLPLPTQGRAEGPSVLGQLLLAGVGRSQSASTEARVQSVAPASSEQRQQLASRLLDVLLQLQGKPDSPAKQQQLTRLNEERQLLDSPLLKLVRLELKHQSLVTFTDRPVTPGENIRVYLGENRLWQVSSRLQSEAARLQQNLDQQPQPTTPNPKLHAVLAQALRSALPLDNKPDLSLTLPQIQQFSVAQRRELFSSPLQHALQRAASQLRQPMQLGEAKSLRLALSQSGVQLENRLAKLIDTARQIDPRPGAARPDSQAVQRVLSHDWKGALLNVLHQVKGDLARLDPAAPLRPNLADSNLSQLLTQLASRPSAELGERVQRVQLLQLLHQHTLHSLARVQLQQLQGLGTQQATAEAPQTAQSWSLEVPMRLGQEVQNLWLQIDQQWLEEEDAQRATGKVRQWQVLLSFELPDAGPLHAQITVRDQQVATRLWAERPETVDTIRGRLSLLQQRLEQNGIEVTKLECHEGAPPRRKTRIHYSLVDVST